MTQSRSPHLRRLRLAGLALTLGLLSACGSAPQQPAEPAPERPATDTGPLQPGVSLQLPPSAFSAEFAAAESALDRFDWMSAELALASLVNPSTLQSSPGEATGPPLEPTRQPDANDLAYLGYLNARIAFVRGRQEQALQQLQELDHPAMHPALRYRNYNLQRHILGLSGHHLESAALGARLLQLAPTQDQAALHRSIWQDLHRPPRSELQRALTGAAASQWRGWLELALVARGDSAALDAAIAQWRAQNSAHPAAQSLPGGLDELLTAATPPETVALILPLSGRLAPAGKAVRDGYLANHYRDLAQGNAQRQLLVLDQDLYPSASAAYDDAVSQGAGLVVGPLSKTAVQELAARPLRPVPLLSLNRIDATPDLSAGALVQLALAPEDEARQIAALAFGKGARRAMILRPADNWGDKMEHALLQRWQELGGSVAASTAFESREDYSDSIKSGLGLASSALRRQQVRDMLATNIEFTPRRRQDIDAIFLLAKTGAQARSIKPLLAFHYAGAIPVYATSSVYTGIPDDRDRDLDGVNLVELPWLLGSNPSLRVAIAAGGTGSDNYTRLNALGADAYLLQSRLAQLRAGPDVLLQGDTGLLTLNPQLQIVRELRPAKFDGGQLRSR
jgi:outer membrane PBP1 activator LpoA protein